MPEKEKSVNLEDIHTQRGLSNLKEQEEPSLGKKLKTLFISDDVENIGGNIVNNYIVPGIINIVTDVLHSIIDSTFNRSGSYRGRSQSQSGKHTSYGSYYRSDNGNERRDTRRKRYSDPSDVPFDTREDAMDVLDDCIDCLERYGAVTVRAFYESAGVEGDYTNVGYGWRDLRGARPQKYGGLWYIDMPRAIDLRDDR